MPQLVTLTGFWSASGSSKRTITVNLDDGSAVEIKSTRLGKSYPSRITNPARLATLIAAAKRKATKA